MLRFEQRTVRGPSGDVLVLTLIGSADIHSAELLESHLASVAGASVGKVVLDLSGLDILSSLGIGAMIGFRKRLSESGSVAVLASVPEPIRKSLKFTRVTELFAIYPSVERAVTG